MVTGNTFFDDTIPLGINATQSLDDSNVFTVASTTASKYNGVIVQGCGQVTSTTQWLVTKAPLVIGDPVTACNYLTVQGGGHLTLGPDVVLKFFTDGSAGVSIGGLLTIDATDWLTCITDDRLNHSCSW